MENIRWRIYVDDDKKKEKLKRPRAKFSCFRLRSFFLSLIMQWSNITCYNGIFYSNLNILILPRGKLNPFCSFVCMLLKNFSLFLVFLISFVLRRISKISFFEIYIYFLRFVIHNKRCQILVITTVNQERIKCPW